MSSREVATDSAPQQPAIPGVLRLAGPLVISFVVRGGFTLVDRFYAASLPLADAAQAGIGLAVPFEFLMIACWVGASNGLTARLAAAMGANEGEKISQLKRAAARIIVALVALFLAIAAGIWFLAPRFAGPEGLSVETMEAFRVYATVLLAGSAITAFWSILPDSIVKAHQDTRSTMWAGLLSGGTNVVLNTVFVFVFHWGILGIALSTVLGRLAGFVYALMRANQHERVRIAAGRDREPGVYARPLRTILAIAVPAATTFVLMAAEAFAVNGILVRMAEDDASLAAWSVLYEFVRFLYMPAIAIGVALLPLTARLYGMGDCTRIQRELRTGLRATLAYGVLFVLPLALFAGPPLARQLTSSDLARRYLEVGMGWLPVIVITAAPLFLYRSTFEGMQRPRPGLIVSAVRAIALIVPLSVAGMLIAPRFGWPGLYGIYAANALGAAVATLAMALWARAVLAREVAERTGDGGGAR